VNLKQVIAAIGVIALLVVVVYPALATGTVAVSIKAGKISLADHVYVTLTDVSGHRAGQSGDQGWELIANQSRTVDLVTMGNSPSILGTGQIPASSYDMIRLDIANVTWVYGKNSTTLQLQTSLVSANLNFTVQAEKSVGVELTLSGQSLNVVGTQYFSPTLTATVSDE
jgi:glycine cleavage system aminomethyltransferase T